jgi:isoleucyl-tRNA synthetase
MNVIGPAYGKLTGEIITILNEVELESPDVEELSKILSESLNKQILITEEMLEFREIFPENVAKSICEFGVIYIDTTLTEEIESEGYTREIIRRIQEMRKEQELIVDQEISVTISIADERILKLIMLHEELIKQEVRATEITDMKEMGMKEWIVEGIPVEIKIE